MTTSPTTSTFLLMFAPPTLATFLLSSCANFLGLCVGFLVDSPLDALGAPSPKAPPRPHNPDLIVIHVCDEARKVMLVSKRLRATSTNLVAKREAAELEAARAAQEAALARQKATEDGLKPPEFSDDEVEEDELEEVPAEMKTTTGYLKDGFVVEGTDSSDEPIDSDHEKPMTSHSDTEDEEFGSESPEEMGSDEESELSHEDYVED